MLFARAKAAERQHKAVFRYEDLLKKHVLPRLGERPIPAVKPIEIKLLYAGLELAPCTQHHTATVLRACMQAAVEVGKLLPVNPAAAVKKPSAGDSDIGQALEQVDALKVFAFTEDQILPHYADGMGTQVNKIMSSNVVAVDPETKLQRVLQMLTKHKVKSLPVIDQRRNLVGIIAREDVMRAMKRWTLRQ